MRRKGPLFCVLALAMALFATAAEADRRVALVIGNAAYKNASTLSNTINDANAIAALFRSVGFEVVSSRTDLGVLEFKRAVRDFLITAETADIAVVYYAGHGIEVNGANYLIPVDAKLARDYDVEDEAVALDRIIWALQPVRRLRLILLDACRDNPFVARLQRSVSVRGAPKNGLAKIDDVITDTLVAYAAKEGSVSYDGAGTNSPFASALLRHLAEPGLDVRIALGRVRDDVLRTTAGRQEPFIYGSLGGSIIPLVPLQPGKAIEPKPAMPPVVAARESLGARPNPVVAPAVPDRIEKVPPRAATAAPTNVEPSAALQSKLQAALERDNKLQAALEKENKSQAALAKENSASACTRDEQQLARLRADPVPDEIARFQRELACSRLIAQVQRLVESVAAAQSASVAPLLAAPAAVSRKEAAPVAAAAGSSPKEEPRATTAPRQQTQAAAIEPQGTCVRDEERLAHLRADPTPDAIAKFDKELSCEKLRPQLRRLRESLGE